MKILIAGCGYIGTALGERLVQSGAEVWGLRRNEEALKKISELGIQPLKADLLDPGTLRDLPVVDAVVLCQGLSRESDSYQTTYERGTANLMEALKPSLAKRIILISSTSVYSTNDGSWVDEKIDTKGADENARCLLAAEKTVLSGGIPSIVLRLAGIYGPGRNRIQALKTGRMKPELSEIYTNRIHRDDIISAILLLMQKGSAGEIYIGADDLPVTQKEFYTWIFNHMNLNIPDPAPASPENHRHVSNKRCSNHKIKTLGFVLKYPTFREGYAELI